MVPYGFDSLTINLKTREDLFGIRFSVTIQYVSIYNIKSDKLQYLFGFMRRLFTLTRVKLGILIEFAEFV
jgi:hypothetical protein